MKIIKAILAGAIFTLPLTYIYAQSSKSSITLGLTPLEREAEKDAENEFGGAYLLMKTDVSTDYVSAGGKIYYRLSSAAKAEEESQKLDVKKVYIKMRPLGSETFELAAGKLYSYYLPGNFFNLAEIYTGASRWGKTGIAFRIKKAGFTGGLALPLSESYKSFDQDGWGLNGSLYYKFSSLPMSFGGNILYDSTGDEDKDKCSKEDFSFSLSSLFNLKSKDPELKMNVCITYSMNAEPYTANSVFKNVVNYSQIGKSQFGSLNINISMQDLSVIIEGESGAALHSDYVPLYIGLQILKSLTQNVSLRPQLFYYGAFNTKDSDLSRDAFTLYPRLMFYFSNYTLSAGAQFTRRQTESEAHQWGFSIPLYLEYKF